MRERHTQPGLQKLPARITPACAGKTSADLFRASRMRDHPRVCGKDSEIIMPSLSVSGSPPRVRERLNEFYPGHQDRRITPACAGKTCVIFRPPPTLRDHPRVCGKDLVALKPTTSMMGSPPRVRERHGMFLAISIYGGITPACAGKTHQVSFGNISCEDHPRVCGKDNILALVSSFARGSPPRVRERPFSSGGFK